MNKNFFILSFFLIYFLSCSLDDSKKIKKNLNISTKQVIKISGSTTVGPILKLYQDDTAIEFNDTEIQIVENGSNQGITDLIGHYSDIAMCSNKISDQKIDSLKRNNIYLEELKIAIDAIVIIVNYKNKVKKLTSLQILDIFSGKVKNWKELGGADQPIHIISRDRSSGTYSYFTSHVLKEKKIDDSALYLAKNQEIINLVAKDENAISYTSLLHSDKVDKVDVLFDEGGTYVKPTIDNVLKHKYRLNRGLYLYYKANNLNKIKPFIDKVKNGILIKYIDKSGFIPYTTSLSNFELDSY